jgi:hypothetical protein
MEFQNKNDYSVTYHFVKHEPVEMKYVHSVYKSHLWIMNKYGGYTYAIVFARRTGRKIKQYNSSDAFIEDKPQ